MPDRYYRLYSPEIRRRHAGLVDRLLADRRQALIDLEVGSGALRLTLVARDRPGLLAHAAGVFDDFDLEVMAADVFSRPGDPAVALDVFRVLPRQGAEQGLDAARLSALERELDRGPDPAGPSPLPRRRRSGSRVSGSTRVDLSDDTAGGRTIVEVQTADGPGVLRRMTQAFWAEGIEILVARCATEGTRAADVFYVPALDSAAATRLAARLHDLLDVVA
jgi:[protein-PII] uridylyltransferase